MSEDYSSTLHQVTYTGPQDPITSSYAKGIFNGVSTIVNTSFFTQEKDELFHPSQLYAQMIDGWRNTYMTSPLPQEITSERFNKKINHYLSISSGYSSGYPVTEWVTRDEDGFSSSIVSTYASRGLLSKNETLLKNSPATIKSFKQVAIKPYKPLGISKDVLRMLNRPWENFAALRAILDEPDDDSGFYTYKGLMILCKHLYMLYDGKGGKEIFRECGDGIGSCKFCGESLPTDVYASDDTLSSEEMAIVFDFIDIINSKQDSLYLFHIIAAAVCKSIQALEMETDERTTAFTCLYLYRLFCDLDEFRNRMKASARFIERLTKEFTEIGWSKSDISATIGNDAVFVDYLPTLEIIRQGFATQEVDDGEILLSVLYYDKTNPMIKIYEQDNSVFGDLNKVIRLKSLDRQLDVWRVEDSIKTPKFVYEGFYSVSQALKFFRQWADLMCPCGGFHKLPCKQCGLDKGMENLDEVMEKLGEKVILQSTMQVASNCHEHGESVDDRKRVIDEILKSEAKADQLDPILLSDSLRGETYKLLESVIGRGHLEKEIKKTEENVKKMYNFIVARGKDNLQWVHSQLSSIKMAETSTEFARLLRSFVI